MKQPVCVWYHQSWEKSYFLRKNEEVQHPRFPPEPQRGHDLRCMFLSSLSYRKAGTAPQSLPSQPGQLGAAPHRRVWTHPGWTRHLHCPAEGVQRVWGFFQSYWRKAVPLARHFMAGALLLWVTSWGCASFPTDRTNHRWNLKICWSLTTAWWAHSLSTCPLPPASDTAPTGRSGSVWPRERWVSHLGSLHGQWREIHSSHGWFTTPDGEADWTLRCQALSPVVHTFRQLILGQKIPLILLYSAWKYTIFDSSAIASTVRKRLCTQWLTG